MALYTPRGLKIRLNINHAFALMARLYPKVDAFKVLKTTEGIESIPGMLAFIAGVLSFSLGFETYQIGLYTFLACVLGMIITTRYLNLEHLLLFFAFIDEKLVGIFRVLVPRLPGLGTLYSYVSGFGILLVVLIVYGIISVGWKGVLAFFIGRIAAELVNLVITFRVMKKIYSETKVPFTTSEIHFFNAYRLHASKLGKTTDTTVSEEELKEENWIECFKDLESKWPEVVERFYW
ncbi:MAG: hypothetical protein OXC39_04530 [Candidatus Dadabacteria bacterium]|nr:hypothetical protein [Candidatus Dadabacteria bacterium]